MPQPPANQSAVFSPGFFASHGKRHFSSPPRPTYSLHWVDAHCRLQNHISTRGRCFDGRVVLDVCRFCCLGACFLIFTLLSDRCKVDRLG
jgi:hypothetical protein